MPTRSGDSGTLRFRERSRPAPALVAALFLWVAVLGWVVPGGSGRWWEPLAVAGIGTALVAGLSLMVVIEVDDHGIIWHRRAGGSYLPHTQIIFCALLSGPALRAVRERNLLSFRVHCPLGTRRGVLLLVDTDSGPQEYLLAVNDLEGFREALDVTDWALETDRVEDLP